MVGSHIWNRENDSGIQNHGGKNLFLKTGQSLKMVNLFSLNVTFNFLDYREPFIVTQRISGLAEIEPRSFGPGKLMMSFERGT